MEKKNKQANWYYAMKGEQVGPVSLHEIKDLVTNEKITAKTKVWNGEGDWKVAKETELSELFKSQKSSDGPPPLTGDDIDDKYIWAIVGVPIVGVIIELIAGTELTLLYLAANIVCCILDEKKLKKAGQEAPETWMAFLIPVYLWKRATLLKQKKHYFWAWCAAFLISIIIGLGGVNSGIPTADDKDVKDLVIEIFQDNKGAHNYRIEMRAIRTISVNKEVKKTKAQAELLVYLANNQDPMIYYVVYTAQYTSDGQLYVTLLSAR